MLHPNDCVDMPFSDVSNHRKSLDWSQNEENAGSLQGPEVLFLL